MKLIKVLPTLGLCYLMCLPGPGIARGGNEEQQPDSNRIVVTRTTGEISNCDGDCTITVEDAEGTVHSGPCP